MHIILGISGSLRRGSHNTDLLREVGLMLPPGVELAVYDRLKQIPPFDEDDRHAPPRAVVDLRERIAVADAVLFATPEYNHSIPGQLKNALDWVSGPIETNTLRSKPAAVIGASTGMFGASWAQAELRKVLRGLGARVIDREVPVPTADQIVRDPQKLSSSGIHPLIVELLTALLAEARETAQGPAVQAVA